MAALEAAIAGEPSFGVLPVGGGARPPPDAAPQAMAAAAWWAGVSHGRWRPRPVLLPPVVLPADPARWCARGGFGPGPRNAPGLARRALLGLSEAAGRDCPRELVIVSGAPLAPHVWRVAEGGVAVAPGRWVRRYAALPDPAPLGAWTHELAHLLLGWPDLPESLCLMGSGARRGGGADPAPPGARLRLGAGWLRAVPATAALRAADLAADEVATLQYGALRLGLLRVGATIIAEDLTADGGPLAVLPIPDAGTPVLAAVLAGMGPDRRIDPAKLGPT